MILLLALDLASLKLPTADACAWALAINTEFRWGIVMASPLSSPTKVREMVNPQPHCSPPSLGRSTNFNHRPNQPPHMVLLLTTGPLRIVNLNHFRLLRVVGKGAFGKVRIVERKDTGLTFALKYIRKDEGQHTSLNTPSISPRLIKLLVVRSESVRNIIRERRMLEHLNHPFLCNLRYSFQDIEYLYSQLLSLVLAFGDSRQSRYIVVDLMNGGDLRFHISRKTFTEEAVRFWMAELGCALRYIHQQGIVHRDLKPDNVLLDLDGHVHLADFVGSSPAPIRNDH